MVGHGFATGGSYAFLPERPLLPAPIQFLGRFPMSKLKVVLLGFGLCASAMAIAHANVLNLKAGLWQTTARIKMTMAGMPTGQTPGHPVVSKSCITDKQLADVKNFAPADRPDCKQTILKNTASEVDAKIECTGRSQASMTGSFKSSSPTAYSGVLQGTVSEQGQSIPISNTIEGKWLSADCGDVKPMDYGAKPSDDMKPAPPKQPN